MKNKLVTALISLVIALGVWAYVVTVESPNSDKSFYNVPVVTQGETLLQDRGLMVTETDMKSASLHLEGSRVDLNKLSSSNITLSLDVSRIYEAGTHDLLYSVGYPGDVDGNAISVMSRNPGSIRVIVEERISKEVPVELQYNGTLAESFVADKENVVLDTREITVTGPKSAVEKITKARITLDLEGRRESISGLFDYTLCDIAGKPVEAALVEQDVQQVNLTLRIVQVKQLELKVNVIPGGGATAQNSVITIDPPSITVSGSGAILQNLTSLELGTVDLGTMPGETTLTFPIKLPEGVENDTGVTEATVTLSFPELETKSLTVSNIVAENVPQGMEVSFITKALVLELRGPAGKLKNLKAEDITIKVDFAGAEAGTVKLKVQVDCGDPAVGAVGTYTVSATVK